MMLYNPTYYIPYTANIKLYTTDSTQDFAMPCVAMSYHCKVHYILFHSVKLCPDMLYYTP